MLGCGDYSAHVLARGGGRIVADLDWIGLSWQRVIDDTSTGSVTLVQDADCCELLRNIRDWKHELAIYRNEDLVWVGPILKPDPSGLQFKIDARDLSAWWDVRLLHTDRVFDLPLDLAYIFEAVANDAMEPDPSPGLVVRATPSGTKDKYSKLAAENVIVGPLLRDLANTAVDWTVVGREALVGGPELSLRPLGPLTDEHFVRPPHPVVDGTQRGTRVIVRGAGSGAQGDKVVGDATNEAARHEFGLIERVLSIQTITDGGSAQKAAESRVELIATDFPIQDAVLTPEAPVAVSDLIPGRRVQLALEDTCIPCFGTWRLRTVDGSGEADTITLTFEPLGATV